MAQNPGNRNPETEHPRENRKHAAQPGSTDSRPPHERTPEQRKARPDEDIRKQPQDYSE